MPFNGTDVYGVTPEDPVTEAVQDTAFKDFGLNDMNKKVINNINN